MPSYLHEILVDIFRRDSALIADLLREVFHKDIPLNLIPRVAEPNFSALAPTEARTDLVVTLNGENGVAFVLILEVQLRPDPDKARRWPYYLASAALRWNCPATLLVVTPDEATARWAARGPDPSPGQLALTPLVLRPSLVPWVADPVAAQRRPFLATLSALAHSNKPGGVDIVVAALEATILLDDDEVVGYHECIFAALDDAARRELEGRMTVGNYEFQSELAKKAFAKWFYEGRAEGEAKGRAEGEARGRAEGEAKGRATAVLAVLRARGIELNVRQRTRVLTCSDIEMLDGWLARAVTATNAHDVLGRG